jgi:hypothetical protein
MQKKHNTDDLHPYTETIRYSSPGLAAFQQSIHVLEYNHKGQIDQIEEQQSSGVAKYNNELG